MATWIKQNKPVSKQYLMIGVRQIGQGKCSSQKSWLPTFLKVVGCDYEEW